MTQQLTRSSKLNLWAFVLIGLCLIPFTVMANSGSWLAAGLGVLFLLAGSGFFIWSLRVQARDGR